MSNAASEQRSSINLIALLLTYKASYFLLIYLAIALLPTIYNLKNHIIGISIHNTLIYPSSAEKFFETWDAIHYLLISQFGYEKGSFANAFFPLWPFCIRLFSLLTGGNYLLSGLILSNVFSITALFALHRFISKENIQLADHTIMLILAFPGAIFLIFPYSESLFLLLSVLIFVQLSKNNYLKAGIFAFFVAMTRPVGFLWVAPMVVHILQKRRLSALPYSLFPLLGYLCYLAFMYLSTGNALESIAAQKGFITNASVGRIMDVAGFLKVLSMPFYSMIGSGFDRIWFALFCVSLWAIWKRDKTMFCFSLVMGLIPALSMSLMSFTRYVLMVFPMFLVMAAFFSSLQRKSWFYLLLAALFGIQIILMIRHINFWWVA